MPRSTLFIDNGGHTIKVLYLPSSTAGASTAAAAASAPASTPQLLVLANSVGAAAHAGTGIIGDQLDSLPHYHGLMVRRPVDRGYIVDGGLQARVWEHVLQRLSIESEEDVDVWLTVPFAAPKAAAQLLWLLCTRGFHFGSVTVVSAAFLALVASSFAPRAPTSGTRKRARDVDVGDGGGSGVAIVVDAGFSATTVVPYLDFIPVQSSIVRLDVGGKVLTNRLKECLSFSQVNVMEDTWLLNHVKERCCLVAPHPRRSLAHYAALWEGRGREEVEEDLAPAALDLSTSTPDVPLRYYLPTIPALLPLGVLEAELPSRVPATSGVDAAALQHLLLCQERFLIPELLFTPADVGIDEQGVAQAVTEGIFHRGLLAHTTTLLKPLLLHSVCVFGGTSSLPHFHTRLEAEVAAAAPPPPLDGAPADRCRPHLRPAPPLPPVLLRDNVSPTDPALQPLLGAWCLLSAHADEGSSGGSHTTRELLRLRALVQQRSTIELQRPPSGRVTVETFQHALQQLM
ncbi:actin-like protein [Novymonas esmeraldas]|uniref:Actin-like protein n=1 Tax=Novymonas esmeraldas TaxID=1808958 RepID=A0AAW0F4L5_9TRYP